MTYFAEIAALSYEDREIVAQVMAEAVPLMTDRQRDCLTLYLAGMTQEEVGAHFGISKVGAHYHIQAALGKVGQVSGQYLTLPSILHITV